jgi:hypothetical protein
VPVPNAAEPFLNVTVPVGVGPAELTVTVKVTDWPYVEGFSPELTVVAVVFLFTLWLTTADVLAR